MILRVSFTSGPGPVILDVLAPLSAVKAGLVGLGATAEEQRSVAFHLGDEVLLVGYDDLERVTTILIGGESRERLAHWLAHQLVDFGLEVGQLWLPPDPAAVAAG